MNKKNLYLINIELQQVDSELMIALIDEWTHKVSNTINQGHNIRTQTHTYVLKCRE